MQELITSIGGQKIRIVADENGIKVEEYVERFFVERVLDGDFIHSETPIPVGVDKNGNYVYIGIARAKYSDQPPREPMLFLCDEHGRKLNSCNLLYLGEDGAITICSSVRTDYAPVGWRFSFLGGLPVKA